MIKKALKLLLGIGFLAGVGTFLISNWGWVFSKKVEGAIINVERVTDPTAILGSKITSEQLHSYSILIRTKEGSLFTASSEDRQWQVVKPGYCVTARLFRYPPWDLQRAGTFFNARLLELSECKAADADGDTQSEK